MKRRLVKGRRLAHRTASSGSSAPHGYTFSGRGDAAGTLEADIASGEITPNVFESMGGDNATPLEPKFTNWYIQYAGTAIVLATFQPAAGPPEPGNFRT